MSNDFIAVLTGVAARVLALAEGDEQLKSQLRQLAQAILVATEQAPPAPEEAKAEVETGAGRAPDNGQVEAFRLLPTAAGDAAESTPVAGAATEPAARPRPVREEREASPTVLHDPAAPVARSPVVTPAASWPEVTDADLPMIEERLRLKAEGCRWAATRRRRTAEGADFRLEIEPLDRELIEKARKLPDCFLWMNHPRGPSPADLSLLDDLGGCFDAAADAVGLVRGILSDAAPDRQALEQSLELLAEAQSALRAAVERADGRPDSDQLKAYQWLRATCGRTQLFIQRYMTVDDAADPTSWPAIDRRVEAIDSRLREGRQRVRQFQSSLKRIRYHLKLILEHKGGDAGAGNGEDRRHDWKIVIDTVDQMVRDGLPPSNTDVRELLLPVIDALPDLELPAGFERVMREIDRFVATRPAGPDEAAAAAPTAEVRAVADLLRGKTAVLIGGARRREAHDALKAAFGLRELDWVETREHESFTTFESHVSRPDVALVILAIRWSSHAFGEVKQYCERYAKPLVRLPAGYNANQVAVQVLAQCSGRLGSS